MQTLALARHIRNPSEREAATMPVNAPDKHVGNEISSFIADLPPVIAKFWAAVAGPLFELSIALFVLSFSIGGYRGTQLKIAGQLNKLPSSMIDSYGLKPVVPIIIIILLLGAAQGTSKVLRSIGAAVPGQLVPDDVKLLVENSTPNLIAEAWEYNAKLTSLGQLNAEIDAAISRLPLDKFKDRLDESRRMQMMPSFYIYLADFVKGLTVVTFALNVFLYLSGLWPLHVKHLLIVVIFAPIVLFYLAIARIRADREYQARKVMDYIAQKKADGLSVEPNNQNDARIRQIGIHSDSCAPSWKLRITPLEASADLCVWLKALRELF